MLATAWPRQGVDALPVLAKNTEGFRVHFYDPTAAAPTVHMPNAQTNVTILDNDPPPHILVNRATPGGYSEEGEVISWGISRYDGPLDQASSVDYVTQPADATSPEDYDGALTGTVHFAPGENLQFVTIDVNDDDVFELTETAAFNYLIRSTARSQRLQKHTK